MTNQKQQAAKDIEAFFAAFGETRMIDGKEIAIIPDEDALQRRRDKSGLDLGTMMFFARASDFDHRPEPDDNMIYDGRYCIVSECKDDAGVFQITLTQNRGR